MSDPHASASAPAEDEPKTPMWLPALGAALFISVGLWWAVTPGAPPPPTDEAVASASAPALAVPTAAPTPQPTPARPPTQGLAPAPIASGALPSRRPVPGNLPPGAVQPPMKQRANPNP
jgi:hypothetical protein